MGIVLNPKEPDKQAVLPTQEPSTNYLGPKWEYLIVPAVRVFGKWSIDPLNGLGQQGWEAIGVFYDAKSSQTYIVFKRPT